MIRLRKSADRGRFDHGWLSTYHTFSFGDYHDPQQMGFRSLRVMNEDWVVPGQGFGMHPHRDMEIITYVLEGELEHRDSMGNGSVLKPGEFQRMSAGTGVRHSEFNPSTEHPVHLYQIWLRPHTEGLPPSYEARRFHEAEKSNRLRLVASAKGREGSLTIHQAADVYLSRLDAKAEVSHQIAPGRHAWLQVLRGAVALNGEPLTAGDGAAVSDEGALSIAATETAEVMLFDLG
jgi:redox-sensitive bicupin YhaK (pirin superfamily)